MNEDKSYKLYDSQSVVAVYPVGIQFEQLINFLQAYGIPYEAM